MLAMASPNNPDIDRLGPRPCAFSVSSPTRGAATVSDMLMQANVASHKSATVCTTKPTDQSTAGPERQTEFYPTNRPHIENARAITLFKLPNCEPQPFPNCDRGAPQHC